MSHKEDPDHDPQVEEDPTHALIDDEEDWEPSLEDAAALFGSTWKQTPSKLSDSIALSPGGYREDGGDHSEDEEGESPETAVERIRARTKAQFGDQGDTLTQTVGAIESDRSNSEAAKTKTRDIARKLLATKPFELKNLDDFRKQLEKLKIKPKSLEAKFFDDVAFRIIGLKSDLKNPDSKRLFDGFLLLSGIIMRLLSNAKLKAEEEGEEEYQFFPNQLAIDLSDVSYSQLASTLLSEKARPTRRRTPRLELKKAPIPMVEARGWEEFQTELAAFEELQVRIESACQTLKPTPQNKRINPHLDIRNRALVTYRVLISNNCKRIREEANKTLGTYTSIQKKKPSKLISKTLQSNMERSRKSIRNFSENAEMLLDGIREETALSGKVLRSISEPFPNGLSSLHPSFRNVVENSRKRSEAAKPVSYGPGLREFSEAGFTPPVPIYRGTFGRDGSFPCSGIVYTSKRRYEEDGQVKRKPVVLVYCDTVPGISHHLEEDLNSPPKQEGDEQPHPQDPIGIYRVNNSDGVYGFPHQGVLIEYPQPEDRVILDIMSQLGQKERLPETLENGATHFNCQRYSIPISIGKGARGEVYECKDRKTGEWIALKTASTPEGMAALMEEYQRTHMIDSKHLVTTNEVLEVIHPGHSYGFAAGTRLLRFPLIKNAADPYLLLVERIAPSTKAKGLSAEMRSRAPHVLEIAIDVCMALIAALEENLVHCDIKPENLLSRYLRSKKRFETKVLDLGAAKKIGESGKDGSPVFAAPETFGQEGFVARPNLDVYALGVSIAVLLTGDKDPWKFLAHARNFFRKQSGFTDEDWMAPDFHWDLYKIKASSNPFTAEEVQKKLPPRSRSIKSHTLINGLLEIVQKATAYTPSDDPEVDPAADRYLSVKELLEALLALKQKCQLEEALRKAELEKKRRRAEKVKANKARKAAQEAARDKAEAQRKEDQRRQIAEALQRRKLSDSGRVIPPESRGERTTKAKPDTRRQQRQAEFFAADQPSQEVKPPTEKLSRRDLFRMAQNDDTPSAKDKREKPPSSRRHHRPGTRRPGKKPAPKREDEQK